MQSDVTPTYDPTLIMRRHQRVANQAVRSATNNKALRALQNHLTEAEVLLKLMADGHTIRQQPGGWYVRLNDKVAL